MIGEYSAEEQPDEHVDRAHGDREIQHRQDRRPPVHAAVWQPQDLDAELAQTLAVEQAEHDREQRGDEQDPAHLTDDRLASGEVDQAQRDEQQHQPVGDVAEDHPEEQREEDADEGRRVEGRVARQRQQPHHQFEGPEVGRVAQHDRHPLQILPQELFLLDDDLRPVGLLQRPPQPRHLVGRDPSEEHEAVLGAEEGSAGFEQRQPLFDPCAYVLVHAAPAPGEARLLFDFEGATSSEGFGQFTLTLDYTEQDTTCCAFAVMNYAGLSPLNTPATNDPSSEWQRALGDNALGQARLRYNAFEDTEGFSPPAADPFSDDYWFDGDLYNKVDVGGVALEWNRDLDSGNSVTFLNAWRHYSSDSAFDGDFTAYDASLASTEVDLDQYSSELRLATPGGETFDGQAGLYAYYSEFDSLGRFEQRESLVDNMILFGDVTLGDFMPDGSVNTDTNLYTTTSYAAFGQVTWNATDDFSLTLGLRYTYERKEREGSQITEPAFFLDLPPIAGPDIFYDDERSDTDLSPSLSARYFFTPDIMAYASVSRGFKSGGFDQRRQALGQDGEFDEEIATNYELGWKTSWGNRRLQFNGSLFRVDYEDFQSQSFDGASVRVTNAGDLLSYGAELELVFIPVANMTLGSALGYNKAEYDEFDNGQCTVEQSFTQYYIIDGAQTGAPGTSSVCTQDLAGKPLDNAPEWTISTFLQYDYTFANELVGIARLEHSYIDEHYLDQDLDPNLLNDAVNLVNMRLTLSNASRDWEASLWGRNMLDEEYFAWGLDIPTLGGYAGAVAPGAAYGVTLRYFR